VLREELIALALRVALFVSLLLLMLPFERIWAARQPRRFRVGVWTDLAHFFVNPIGVSHALALAFIGLELVFASAVPDAWRHFFGGMPFFLQLGCVLFVGELCSYWTHRLSHSWSFLWRFHAVHHSSENVDWLSAHRQHPFDTILFLVAANLPAIALGFRGPLVVFVAVFHRTFVTFTHASLRLELRWLRLLIVTPRYHHHHHHRDASPSNFAGLFPFFDLLFGTFRWPEALPAHYGVPHRVSRHWLGQLFLPLIRAPARAPDDQIGPYPPQ
jgi:sterol desaturase/sphingolipid hydroxylase (fatty acid hydroxylase superfamily)